MRLLPSRVLRYLLPMVRATDVLEELRHLPVTDVSKLLGDRPLLVLAPHPDDESLGCGGLIAECHARGQEVRVLVLTDGSRSHPHSREYPPARLAALRMDEARAAVVELGLAADRIDFLGLLDGHAPLHGPSFRAAATRIAQHARAHAVGTICTTWPHDPHHDHLAAYRLARLAAGELGAKLLCYPVWGWTLPSTAWLPATRIDGARLDIAHHLPAKRRAIACHRSQIGDLIRDDPGGFRASPELLAIFDQPFEIFLES